MLRFIKPENHLNKDLLDEKSIYYRLDKEFELDFPKNPPAQNMLECARVVFPNDIKLGEIGGVPFYMNGDQYEKWKHTDLTIDAVNGIGGMFSLDNGTGKRFLTKSEICL